MSSPIRKIQKRVSKEKMNTHLVALLTDLIRFKNKTDTFLSVFEPAKDSSCQELKDLSAKIDKDYNLKKN